MGRGDDNDMPVHGRFVSRIHASVEYRHGRFHLRDNSTNGTVLVMGDAAPSRIHREDVVLNGDGVFCLGASPEEDPDAVVHFACH